METMEAALARKEGWQTASVFMLGVMMVLAVACFSLVLTHMVSAEYEGLALVFGVMLGYGCYVLASGIVANAGDLHDVVLNRLSRTDPGLHG